MISALSLMLAEQLGEFEAEECRLYAFLGARCWVVEERNANRNIHRLFDTRLVHVVVVSHL